MAVKFGRIITDTFSVQHQGQDGAANLLVNVGRKKDPKQFVSGPLKLNFTNNGPEFLAERVCPFRRRHRRQG